MKQPSFLISLSHAFRGLRSAFQSERNLRIHIVCLFAVMAAGMALQVSIGEWVALALVCGLVITSELINTAIETVVDLASPDRDPLAGRAKDVSAAAVLIAAIAAILVGLLIFTPPVLKLCAVNEAFPAAVQSLMENS